MPSVIILADIEGSTGCSCREDSLLFTPGWARACVEMSHDLSAVCNELKSIGVTRIRIKDFHRTGFNIFRELLPPWVELDQGYKKGPAIGIGEVSGFDQLMMIGMHAGSGTNGFLPHTLTSKFAAIYSGNDLLCEAQLFAASVAKFELPAVFFSGCDEACRQAKASMPWLHTFTVNKPVEKDLTELRTKLAMAAAKSLTAKNPQHYFPDGQVKITAVMRDGKEAAQKMRRRWKISGKHAQLEFVCDNILAAYWQLIQIAYLGPFSARFIRPSLALANFFGRLSHCWARFYVKKTGLI